LASVERPSFLTAGKPTASEKKYFGLDFNPSGNSSSSRPESTSNSTSAPHSGAASSAAAGTSAPAHDSSVAVSAATASISEQQKERLSQRQRNKLQEQRGQATFTLKDGRDMPDLYRPSHGVSPQAAAQAPSGDGRRIAANKRNSDLLTQGISQATATRDKKARASQMQKVQSGQSFEGRTWKSEQEMVMRQSYD
jgi:hypothetical protein